MKNEGGGEDRERGESRTRRRLKKNREE